MNTIAAFARDSLFLCARASVKTSEFCVPQHGHALRTGLSYVTGIWHHLVPLLIICLHTAASRSSAICNWYSTCDSALETRVVSTRGVPSWIRCLLLDLCIQHLLGLVLRVLMYLSRLLIVAVANELATLGVYPCQSPPHKKEKNVGRFSRYCWSPSPPCCWLCSAGSCLHPHPQDSGCPR